jgi:ParB family chromosome partitioning protein
VAGTQQLAASLKAHGQFVPIIAFPLDDGYGIADGERRWGAAKHAEIQELAAIVLDTRPTPAELLKLQLQVNCLRKSLKPVERALAYQRLLEAEQCSQRTLAQMLHVSDAAVTSCLALLQLSPEIQARVDSGEVPLSSAYAISRVADPAVQLSLADQAAAGSLTRDALQGRVRKKTSNGVKAKRVTCVVGEHTVTVSGAQRMDLDGVLTVLGELAREARRARGQGLDVLTWVRVLRDKSKANGAGSVDAASH